MPACPAPCSSPYPGPYQAPCNNCNASPIDAGPVFAVPAAAPLYATPVATPPPPAPVITVPPPINGGARIVPVPQATPVPYMPGGQ